VDRGKKKNIRQGLGTGEEDQKIMMAICAVGPTKAFGDGGGGIPV
jgi:hypothetical protein